MVILAQMGQFQIFIVSWFPKDRIFSTYGTYGSAIHGNVDDMLFACLLLDKDGWHPAGVLKKYAVVITDNLTLKDIFIKRYCMGP